MRIPHVRSMLPALLLLLALPIASHAQIGVGLSITFEPPELPVYEQPPLPAPGFLWMPGYWAWGDDDYYWVPGTWVEPPTVGVLWTPGYWGWQDGVYVFNDGYWGPHVGFYGGVNYGFGYGGVGFEGGEWRNNTLFYNRSVVNISNVQVTNVYNKTVIVNNTTRVSYNGGTGGVPARPTPAESSAAQEHHVPPTPAQTTHVHQAIANHDLKASVNHGAPPVAATPKPGVFSGAGIVKTSHAAPYKAPPAHAAAEKAAPGKTPAEHATAEKAAPGKTPAEHATAEKATPGQGPPERATAEKAAEKPAPRNAHASPPPPAPVHAAPRPPAPTHPAARPEEAAAHPAPPPHAAPPPPREPPPKAPPPKAPPEDKHEQK
jgi:WXXGXW repeat (2 copies)